jgi:predicted permease
MIELVLPVFALVGVGWFLRRVGILDAPTSYRMVDLIMYVTFPATLFLGLTQAPMPKGAWMLPLWAIAAMLVSGALTYSYTRITRMSKPDAGALIVASAFGNSAFLGVPLCYMIYGATGRVSAVIYDMLGVSLPLYGIGFAVLEAYGGRKMEWRAVASFVKTPVFWTAVAGFSVRALTPWWNANIHASWAVGHVFIQTLELLSPLTAPLAMLALGVNFRLGAVREYLPAVTVSCIAKVVLMPLAAWLLYRAFGPPGIAGKTAVLEAAMPGGIVAGALCGRYGCNPRLGAAITVGTTLAALVTLPLWLTWLGR